MNKKLEQRVRDYISRTKHAKVDASAPVTMALAPVQAGLVSYVDVDDLPDLDSLPRITERKRDFAFRYGSEYKPVKEWAREYKVHPQTVTNWLSDPKVQAYIAVTRYERRMLTLARYSALDNLFWKRMYEFMTQRITNDNAEAMRKAMEFAYSILNNPEEAANRTKGAFNQTINVGGPSNPPMGNPYAQTERNVTPPTEKQMAEFKRRMEQAAMIMERASKGET